MNYLSNFRYNHAANSDPSTMKNCSIIPHFLSALILSAGLSACGGGGGGASSPAPTPAPASTYLIGGNLSGLASGTQITLQNNSADALTLTANSAFNFATKVASNGSYKVTISSQPAGQTCTVNSANSSGSSVTADVSSVSVTCVYQSALPLSMLHASGTKIVDATGAAIQLRGVNLGGWFIMEKWMAPLDSGNLIDTYSVIQKLDTRFGVAAEQSLINTYQQSWITTTDLDNIKNAGFNLVRVPVWWGQFYPLNNTSNAAWRADAFTMLDWLVTNAAARGIYVIIDMHGVVGGQSTSDDTGYANQNTYWTDAGNQASTAFMWSQIAAHYNGNPAVAGYDLLNEPMGAPNSAAVITAYNNLYKTVRAADSNHLIFLEGTFGTWSWNNLPAPSQNGWTNVVYEMHEYQYNSTAAQVTAGSDNQVSDFINHASWNVPGYIGEYNDFGYGAPAWQHSINAYDNAGLSWSSWSYKAIAGPAPNSWGWYDPTNSAAITPNISTDSAATSASDWQQWTTTASFGLNTSLNLRP